MNENDKVFFLDKRIYCCRSYPNHDSIFIKASAHTKKKNLDLCAFFLNERLYSTN